VPVSERLLIVSLKRRRRALAPDTADRANGACGLVVSRAGASWASPETTAFSAGARLRAVRVRRAWRSCVLSHPCRRGTTWRCLRS